MKDTVRKWMCLDPIDMDHFEGWLEAMAQKRCLEACRYCLRGTTAFVPVPPEA